MAFLTEKRRLQALELAQEITADHAPGLLTMTQLATRVGQRMGIQQVASARLYLRTSVRMGLLVELKPDVSWRVRWDPAARAGVDDLRIVAERYEVEERVEATRLVLSNDPLRGRPRHYGPPDHATYVMTREQAASALRTAQAVQRHRDQRAER